MRILWIKPFFLHPTRGGAEILSLQILRRLHNDHEIDFIAHRCEATAEEEMAGTPEFCTSATAVKPVVFKKHFRPYVLQLGRELLWGTGAITSPDMIEQVGRLLSRNRYDAVVADSVFVAPAIPRGVPYTLIAHNVEGLIEERHASTETVRGIILHHLIRARHLRRLESDAFHNAHRVLALSPVDAGIIRQRSGREQVATLSFGADVEGLARPAQSPALQYDLIFVGAMDTGPNAHGAKWFVRNVLPLIRRQRPDCRLAIVGRSPDEELKKLSREDPGIVVSGTVPDVRPWLWASRVSIVPLLVGSGIRLKIYEAMAASLPVVSTSIGAEGLMISPGSNILLADSPDDFARQVLRLLDDAEFRELIARAGWQMVRDSFSWDRVAEDVESNLES